MSIELLKSDEDNIYTAEAGDGKFLTVVANENIANGIEYAALEQSCCVLHNQGVEDVILTPDAHQGYGVAIGSVIKTNGSIFPDYVGVDISCGMRAILTSLDEKSLKDRRKRQHLVDEIKKHVPVGPNCQSSVRFDEETTRSILQGKIQLDEPSRVERSDLQTDMRVESGAVSKSQAQLGSLGGGNHFIEIQVVEEVDGKLSERWGIYKDQIILMIHSGSRRVGYDICNRYKGELLRWFDQQGIDLEVKSGVWALTNLAPPSLLEDAQEAFLREKGEAYIQEMYMANNFAVASRNQMQEAVLLAFRKSGYKTKNFQLLYDISHNIASIEDGKVIIRKGATRAFPKGHHMLKGTEFYETGHPIILPGSMDTASYIMVGTQHAVRTHYSINHGAGRKMSRRKARETLDRRIAKQRMKNIVHNHPHLVDIIDETGGAYKDISEITSAVVGAGIAKIVAKVTPRAVIKG